MPIAFPSSPDQEMTSNGMPENGHHFHQTVNGEWQRASQETVANQELSWLLMEDETEQELLANPYMFKDDVDNLLSSIFDKSMSSQGGDSKVSSLDIQRYYLDKRPHQTQMDLNSSASNFDKYSHEPLFLVKWGKLSYAQISWEPLSVLNGDNMKKVSEFLTEKRGITMNDRLINSKNISNQI